MKEGDNNNLVAAIANDDLFFACDENVINLVLEESNWFVDFGVIFHITPKKELFFLTLQVILQCWK